MFQSAGGPGSRRPTAPPGRSADAACPDAYRTPSGLALGAAERSPSAIVSSRVEWKGRQRHRPDRDAVDGAVVSGRGAEYITMSGELDAMITDVDVRSLAAKLKGLHALLAPGEQVLLHEVLRRAAAGDENGEDTEGYV